LGHPKLGHDINHQPSVRFFPRRRKNPIKTQLKQTIKFDPKTTQFKSNNVKIKLEQKKYDYNPQYYGVFSSTNEAVL
jgi:hypothetical protein